MIGDSDIRHFQQTVWDFYHEYGRHELPWRCPEADGSFDPYKITVSEIMLQQTQVKRVISKYTVFLEHFPTVQSLAQAKLGAVLRLWSGLGYNRRAKFLHQTAASVVRDYEARIPATVPELSELPGIGANTAGAIVAYAYSRPVVFLETNIRTALIHHFLPAEEGIGEKTLRQLAEEVLDTEQVREWYWALVDYGAYLKQTIGNLNTLSVAYNKQSAFHGSRRQIRGQVLRLLAVAPLPAAALHRHIPDERLEAVLAELVQENMIQKARNTYSL